MRNSYILLVVALAASLPSAAAAVGFDAGLSLQVCPREATNLVVDLSIRFDSFRWPVRASAVSSPEGGLRFVGLEAEMMDRDGIRLDLGVIYASEISTLKAVVEIGVSRIFEPAALGSRLHLEFGPQGFAVVLSVELRMLLARACLLRASATANPAPTDGYVFAAAGITLLDFATAEPRREWDVWFSSSGVSGIRWGVSGTLGHTAEYQAYMSPVKSSSTVAAAESSGSQ